MNLKQNDLVEVEGKQARIQGFWNQGSHRIFKLSDGREFFDLHKGVENGTVKLIDGGNTTTFNEVPIVTKKVQFPGFGPTKVGETDNKNQ